MTAPVDTPESVLRAEIAEQAARFVENWLLDWGSDLAGTFEDYIAATRTGKFAGRKIAPEQARTYARQFRERAEAVSGCAELLARDLRAHLSRDGGAA